jgi:hypothetical protein
MKPPERDTLSPRERAVYSVLPKMYKPQPSPPRGRGLSFHTRSPWGEGGERAAALYSLIGAAKLNSLDPESYLRDVLSRIADHPINRIDELLPWNDAAQGAEHPSSPQ